MFLMTVTQDLLAQSVRSPEVHGDRTVTFRMVSRTAQSVKVLIAGQQINLAKDDSHIWAATSPPLSPGIHDYTFDIDGTRVIDPSNRNVKKWLTLASMVEVPGDPPLLTEFQDVPHGVVHRLFYPSKSVGRTRPVVVYTPPQYDVDSEQRFPVLVLMHGFGDDETAWTEVGRAHLIVDNLLAEGRILPCVIAMPYGHPVPVPFGERPEDYFPSNNELYESDVIEDLLPFLESRFRLSGRREDRSLAGLSMGGGHAIHIGLRNTDQFSAIGAFSAATPQLTDSQLVASYPSLEGKERGVDSLKVFWIPIGDRDFLLERNEKFIEQLTVRNVSHEFLKTSGGHEWKLWREYLPRFLMKVVPAVP